MATAKLIAHIIHRLDYGGMENGLVNLVNHIPQDRYQHAIICLTEYSDFAQRITNPNVSLHALHKSEGKDFHLYFRLWRLLRKLQPDIVHTRNLAALEGAVVAWLAGIPGRVHGEHGLDVNDINGTNQKYLLLRRLCKPFIQRYIPVSRDLEKWLKLLVKVPSSKIRQIYNGVDAQRFYYFSPNRRKLPIEDFAGEEQFVIGTVGRIQKIKDQFSLLRAVACLLERDASYRQHLRLVVVGEGPMMPELKALAKFLGLTEIVWFAGARDDVPEILQALDLYVLSSMREGISNSILEAMATGLPMIVTGVGGNPELVLDGQTGIIVPAEDSVALADAIQEYFHTPEKVVSYGKSGRKRIETEFSIDAMVKNYLAVYEELSFR